MDNPFLTIITRTCNRPNLLQENIESINKQTDGDFEHLFIVDEIGRGKIWAQASLNKFKNDIGIKGKYVFILDDDDILVDPDFVSILKERSKDSNPDLIMFRGKLSNKIYPPDVHFGKPPIHTKICTFCFATERNLYMENIHHWAKKDSGDYHYIHNVYSLANRILWIDKVFAKALKISHGIPGE